MKSSHFSKCELCLVRWWDISHSFITCIFNTQCILDPAALSHLCCVHAPATIGSVLYTGLCCPKMSALLDQVCGEFFQLTGQYWTWRLWTGTSLRLRSETARLGSFCSSYILMLFMLPQGIEKCLPSLCPRDPPIPRGSHQGLTTKLEGGVQWMGLLPMMCARHPSYHLCLLSVF